MSTQTRPSFEGDLFADEHLHDPYPVYRRLREEGGAVWLPQISCWAVPRYDGVRNALQDWQTYTSAKGVGMNDDVNAQLVGTVLASDPPLHDTLRDVLAERLSPRAVRGLAESIRGFADELVGRLVARGTFDAVRDLAQVFPPTIVADLVGLPQEIRPRLLPWGDGLFNGMGPVNDRTIGAIPVVQEQYGWLHQLDGSELAEGSMGRAIFDAAEAGVIDRASAPQLLSAYTSAAMDTTVSSIGSAIWLFSQHPEQWEAFRADRSLAIPAFHEVIRMETPLQMFSRVTTRPVEIDGTAVEAGERLLMMYGSANRDERQFGDDADRFDITRDASEHLAFGIGLHGCAGQGLARLEAQSVLNALADRVASFETVEEPVRHLNNTVRSLDSLVIRVESD